MEYSANILRFVALTVISVRNIVVNNKAINNESLFYLPCLVNLRIAPAPKNDLQASRCPKVIGNQILKKELDRKVMKSGCLKL